ncbi:unnamed protein product [Chrysoparadoxa australica]
MACVNLTCQTHSFLLQPAVLCPSRQSPSVCAAGSSASQAPIEFGEKVTLPGISFRSATLEDLDEIAAMCIEVFRGPFKWFEKLSQKQQEMDFEAKIRSRMNLINWGKLQHALVVATLDDTGVIVGYMEVGMLPLPPNFEVSKDGVLRKAKSVQVGQFQDARPDEPYIANLVVSGDARRRGIGRMLVEAGEEIVSQNWKRNRVYLTVEPDNPTASKLYESCGFEFIGAYKPQRDNPSVVPGEHSNLPVHHTITLQALRRREVRGPKSSKGSSSTLRASVKPCFLFF